MQDILTSCEHCAHRFEVPRSAAGSLWNCPSCGRATRIPGESDPAWVPFQLIVAGLCVAAGVIVSLGSGQVGAGFAVGGGLLAAALLLRAAL